MFDKHDQYKEMMQEHELRDMELEIWKRVKDSLPAQGKSSLVMTMKSLRRWVDFKDGKPFIPPEAMIEHQPVWAAVVKDEEFVLTWISQNWQEIKALEKARAVSQETEGRRMHTAYSPWGRQYYIQDFISY